MYKQNILKINKLTVLHINLSLGGIGRYGALFGKGLSSINDHNLISIYNNHLFHTSDVEQEVKDTKYFKVNFNTKWLKLKSIIKIIGIIRKNRPGIIHDSAGTTMSIGLILWPIFYYYSRLIITIHDPIPHSGMGYRWKDKLIRLCAYKLFSVKLFVHGNTCKKYLMSFNVDSHKINIIKHGHLYYFNKNKYNKIKRKNNYILFFGALRPNKGLELLTQIADIVNKNSLKANFVVAGSKNMASEIMKSNWPRKLSNILIDMKGRADFEVHDKFIDDEEVEYFFKLCGITLLPYKDATQSGVVMIAMPFGSVVISTNRGDIPEVVRKNKTGFICEYNAAELANCIIELLKNENKMNKIRDNAKKEAFNFYSWELIAQDSIYYYEILF